MLATVWAAATAAALNQSGRRCCFSPTLSRYRTPHKQQTRVWMLRNPAGLKTPLCMQFDKVQENFLSLEQQISTFQAHLEGLGRGNQNGSAGNFTHAQTFLPVSLKTSDVSPEHQNSTSVSTSVSSVEENTGAPLSLRERSALNFSSAVGRLRKSGRRKWLFSDYGKLT